MEFLINTSVNINDDLTEYYKNLIQKAFNNTFLEKIFATFYTFPF